MSAKKATHRARHQTGYHQPACAFEADPRFHSFLETSFSVLFSVGLTCEDAFRKVTEWRGGVPFPAGSVVQSTRATSDAELRRNAPARTLSPAHKENAGAAKRQRERKRETRNPSMKLAQVPALANSNSASSPAVDNNKKGETPVQWRPLP